MKDISARLAIEHKSARVEAGLLSAGEETSLDPMVSASAMRCGASAAREPAADEPTGRGCVWLGAAAGALAGAMVQWALVVAPPGSS